MAVVAVFGVVLGAWYMLYLVQRVFFGPLHEPELAAGASPPRDLSFREMSALVPLVVFMFWIGLHPDFFLSRMRPTLEPRPPPPSRPCATARGSHDASVAVGQGQTATGGLTRVE